MSDTSEEKRAWAAMSKEQRKIVSAMDDHICKQKHQIFRAQLFVDAEDILKERAMALALAMYEEPTSAKRIEHARSARQVGAALVWLRAKASARSSP